MWRALFEQTSFGHARLIVVLSAIVLASLASASPLLAMQRCRTSESSLVCASGFRRDFLGTCAGETCGAQDFGDGTTACCKGKPCIDEDFRDSPNRRDARKTLQASNLVCAPGYARDARGTCQGASCSEIDFNSGSQVERGATACCTDAARCRSGQTVVPTRQVPKGSDTSFERLCFSDLAMGAGSAIYINMAVHAGWDQQSLNVVDTTFAANQAVNEGMGASGGAVYVSGIKATVRRCMFVGNSASSGGAMYITSPGPAWSLQTMVVIEETSFINNKATYGGALNIKAGNVNITRTNMAGNTALYAGGGGGGAMQIGSRPFDGNSPSVTIQMTSFTGNSAQGMDARGGGITIEDGVILIIDAIFLENRASAYGGAIYMTGATLQLQGTEFTGNLAYRGGGALGALQ